VFLVFAVAVIVVATFYSGSRDHAPINSVAVLPFANATGDPNAEYLKATESRKASPTGCLVSQI